MRKKVYFWPDFFSIFYIKNTKHVNTVLARPIYSSRAVHTLQSDPPGSQTTQRRQWAAPLIAPCHLRPFVAQRKSRRSDRGSREALPSLSHRRSARERGRPLPRRRGHRSVPLRDVVGIMSTRGRGSHGCYQTLSGDRLYLFIMCYYHSHYIH